MDSKARFTHCPKCRHTPLPAPQGFAAACPQCGVILAKVGQRPQSRKPARDVCTDESAWRAALLHVPERVDRSEWAYRVVMWLAFTAWSVAIVRHKITDQGLAGLADNTLLVFHEAGHALFAPFGWWMGVFGGTLGQWLMPLVLCGALLWKNRDPFGASLGLWFFGVSLMNSAMYMYDALDPQQVLITGDIGGPSHDWINLFSDMGRLGQAQSIGQAVWSLGVMTVWLALAWGGCMLWLQRRHTNPDAGAPLDPRDA